MIPASSERVADMNDTLDRKNIIVTGATGFLGSAIVQQFLDEGAVCHVTWQVDTELERFALKGHERVVLHQVDVTNEEQVNAFYQRVDGLWASVHVVGGFLMGSIIDTSADQFRSMFELNVMTCFLCCRGAVRKMRAGKGGGRIINIGARPAVQPVGGMIAYTTAKAAVTSLTQCLAEEVKGEDILVNAVLPSIMDTKSNRSAMPDADFDKWPKVEEVAETIAFLASPGNALTSGALVPVYGQV